MRIGFDGKRAIRNFTGLGNYSRSTIKLLAEQYPEDDFFVYARRFPEHPRTAFLSHSANIHPKTPPQNSIRPLWRSWSLSKQLTADHLDVYHGLSHELPFSIRKTGIKTVVTIHDLIFLRFPQYYSRIDVEIYRRKFRFACLNADRIIAISEQTKRDIVHFFKIDPDKISVIYQSCDPLFGERMPAERLQYIGNRYALPKKYLLSVGTIETRKNLLLALKALHKLPTEWNLVAIGRKTPYFKELHAFIQKAGLQNRVLFLENVDFNDLPGIYQQAEMLVYPSRFEGFGIPVIEALQSQIPVIAATGSCLEEAGGQHSAYINPDDINSLLSAIEQIDSNSSLRQTMIEKGVEHAQLFHPQHVAKELMNTYLHL